jgi:hypothetical protein
VKGISSFNTDGLLDLTEAANYLKISNRALRELCRRRLVSYELSSTQTRPAKYCATEIRALKVRQGEFCLPEFCPAEVR